MQGDVCARVAAAAVGALSRVRVTLADECKIDMQDIVVQAMRTIPRMLRYRAQAPAFWVRNPGAHLVPGWPMSNERWAQDWAGSAGRARQRTDSAPTQLRLSPSTMPARCGGGARARDLDLWLVTCPPMAAVRLSSSFAFVCGSMRANTERGVAFQPMLNLTEPTSLKATRNCWHAVCRSSKDRNIRQ